MGVHCPCRPRHEGCLGASRPVPAVNIQKDPQESPVPLSRQQGAAWSGLARTFLRASARSPDSRQAEAGWRAPGTWASSTRPGDLNVDSGLHPHVRLLVPAAFPWRLPEPWEPVVPLALGVLCLKNKDVHPEKAPARLPASHSSALCPGRLSKTLREGGPAHSPGTPRHGCAPAEKVQGSGEQGENSSSFSGARQAGGREALSGAAHSAKHFRS